jgi:transcriptional regulator with XRE-family HTH domain
MRALYLPYRKRHIQEDSSWGLVGKDSHGADFGVGVGPAVEVAEQRLREWVIDSLIAAAGDGEDRLGDLVAKPPRGAHVAFMPVDLVPIRMRLIRARKHLSQADVAKKLGLTQQAYAKLERPGANLQLRTIEQVEKALDAELLQLASGAGLTATVTATGVDSGGRPRTKKRTVARISRSGGRRRTSKDSPLES